jgi:hypothetical protein
MRLRCPLLVDMDLRADDTIGQKYACIVVASLRMKLSVTGLRHHTQGGKQVLLTCCVHWGSATWGPGAKVAHILRGSLTLCGIMLPSDSCENANRSLRSSLATGPLCAKVLALSKVQTRVRPRWVCARRTSGESRIALYSGALQAHAAFRACACIWTFASCGSCLNMRYVHRPTRRTWPDSFLSNILNIQLQCWDLLAAASAADAGKYPNLTGRTVYGCSIKLGISRDVDAPALHSAAEAVARCGIRAVSFEGDTLGPSESTHLTCASLPSHRWCCCNRARCRLAHEHTWPPILLIEMHKLNSHTGNDCCCQPR